MDKPAFDPSQPFESTDVNRPEEAKPAFDSSKPFDTAPPEQKGGSGIETAISLAKDMGKRALSGLGKVGRAVDTETGAPLRAAILAAEEGKNPLSAGWEQFKSQDSGLAPTGEQIFKKTGIPPDTAARALGPVAHIAAEAYPELASKVIGAGVEAAANPLNATLIPGASEALGSAAGRLAAKLGSTLSGAPEADILTYATKAPEVKALLKESGGNIQEAADLARSRINSGVKSFKDAQNSAISQGLASASPEKTIDASPILEAINSSKSKINPALDKESAARIDDLVNRVSSLASDGKISVQDAQDIKNFLYGKGSSSFTADGEIFSRGSPINQAAKSGAGQAKKIMDKMGPESIRGANSNLSQLHEIDDTMPGNLLTVGKPAASLIAGGSEGNARSLQALEDIGELTGQDALGQAKLVSAANTFGNPALLAADTTGKSMLRHGLGAGLGYLVDGPMGALAGGALTSPAAVKLAIDAGRIPASILNAIPGGGLGLLQGLEGGYHLLEDPTIQAMQRRYASEKK